MLFLLRCNHSLRAIYKISLLNAGYKSSREFSNNHRAVFDLTDNSAAGTQSINFSLVRSATHALSRVCLIATGGIESIAWVVFSCINISVSYLYQVIFAFFPIEYL